MKKAIIYTRISTDETKQQFSLRDQKARLQQFCQLRSIEIVQHYQEEYSAKTFDRPEFQKLLRWAKSHRNEVDYLLVIRWDRFSRNLTQSLETIRQFQDMGIEPNSVEGWIDYTTPENLLMLAFYLASPEVENTRRSLNTIAGMRRAAKEGRWTGVAPLGYRNARDENNRPIVVIDSRIITDGVSQGDLMRQLFEEFALGEYGMEELRKKYYKRGLKMSRARIGQILRSEFYAGKIPLKAWKDEPFKTYQGIHEPLITEETYWKVQSVLEGRKLQGRKKNSTTNENLPLRGILICGQCQKVLTGSGSRSGNGQRHFYYHCRNGCKERFRADGFDKWLTNFFDEIKPTSEVIELYLEVLRENDSAQTLKRRSEKDKIKTELKKYEAQLNSLEEKFITDAIARETYQKWRATYQGKIMELKEQLKGTESVSKELIANIAQSTHLLCNLDEYYAVAPSHLKKRLVSSIFSENLLVENGECRTTELRPEIALLSAYKKKKPSVKLGFSNKSNRAPPARFELATNGLTVHCSTAELGRSVSKCGRKCRSIFYLCNAISHFFQSSSPIFKASIL